MDAIETSTLYDIARIILGLFMLYAGIGHMTFLRKPFRAQVPDWVPLEKDLVVLLSGIVEILLGAGMVLLVSQKVWVGIALAIFYVLIFPGNIAQYTEKRNAFGLDTDRKRFIRLLFQPVLILWALWSTGALEYIFSL